MGRSISDNGISPAARVVVADADQRASGVLSWLLRERGYEVVATQPAALIDVLRSYPADLVLLADCQRTALDTLRQLRADEHARAIPVVVTGIAAPEDASLAIREGADDYLGRPLRVTELLAALSTQLRIRDNVRMIRETLAQREHELQRALDDIAASRQLVEILNEITTDLTTSEIYRLLARRVARALDLSHCSVVLANAGEASATVVAAFENQTVKDLEVRLSRYPEFVEAMRTQRPVLIGDVQHDPMFADIRRVWESEGRPAPMRSVLAIPFALERGRGGVFFLRTAPGERALSGNDAAFAEVVIRVAVAAIRRAQALESTRADNRRLEELATTDALTRLLNRRAMHERLSAEVDRARRFKSQFSLLMVDLDHFKSINDQHGHLVGDAILRQLGSLLASSIRTVDIVARYGGEEFVMILPETATEGATVFAERLRERIREHRFEVDANRTFHLTCSVGVATFPSPRVTSTDDLFARADEALYRAKSGGRNMVRA
ncbi:MAG: diguanylate cyclase [Gemmatimonadaceae bacterium]